MPCFRSHDDSDHHGIGQLVYELVGAMQHPIVARVNFQLVPTVILSFGVVGHIVDDKLKCQ